MRRANPAFAALGVRPECLGLLKKQSITEPMPIQAEAIAPATEGRDLVAIAQTGTGKTLAFGLPLLTRLAESDAPKATALILSPTRELAQQIYDVLNPLARALNMNATCVYGGVGIGPQTRDLRAGGGVVIATPGRLMDHINRKNTDFSNLTTLVLDEADRMLDMGFMPDIKRIMAQLPEERQTLMFSATFPDEIARLTRDMLNNPQRIEIERNDDAMKDIRQCAYTVAQDGKLDLLKQLLGDEDAIRSAIIFVRTRRRADRVAKSLGRGGFSAGAIHGDRSQSQRQHAIRAFARGKSQFLVATDVAARGIDVEGISHVINYDMPQCADDYTHRIGRTARAHADGDAITFVSHEDGKVLTQIERTQGQALEQIEWDGAITLPASQPGNQSRPGGRKHGGKRQQWKNRRNKGRKQMN
ncbi:MAG: DEAD/DEAH box helicase [Candidatus Sumerlaeota bacterium]